MKIWRAAWRMTSTPRLPSWNFQVPLTEDRTTVGMFLRENMNMNSGGSSWMVISLHVLIDIELHSFDASGGYDKVLFEATQL